MSPALVTKYLDAAKEIAGHAVLLPDGFRFSRHTTRRDWTDERLRQIREFYRQLTDPGGGDKVNLQGIVFQTNEGGRLPLEKYLAATLAEREPLAAGSKNIEAVAAEHGLNAKYLRTLWTNLSKAESSLILDGIRARWRTAKPDDAASLTTDIETWQRSLWKFSTVGHIGKAGGPKRWLEPVNPLVSRQELRLKIPATMEAKEITISLMATDAGDGNAHDFVVWERPRFVAAGKADVLLAELCRSGQSTDDSPGRDIGLDAAMFGKHPVGRGSIDADSVCVQAPRTIELHLPAELVAGTELAATGVLDQVSGAEGSVQLQLIAGKPPREAGLVKTEVTIAAGNGPWTSNNQKISFSTPILVNENSAARKCFEAAFDEFRDLFPAALCYTKIVPVDEVVTLTLFYREDDPLARLMLDERNSASSTGSGTSCTTSARTPCRWSTPLRS